MASSRSRSGMRGLWGLSHRTGNRENQGTVGILTDPRQEDRTASVGQRRRRCAVSRGSQTLAVLAVVCLCAVTVFAEEGVRTVLVEAVRPGLELTVDKGCGGTYLVGETLDVTVRSELDGYLTLFDFTTNGQVHRIFPNRHYQDNWIDRDVDYTIPGNLMPFLFRVAAPEGEELLLAIVTSCPFEVLADDYYDFSNVFPLILLAERAAAEAITGSLGLVPTQAEVALDVTYFNVALAGQPVSEPAAEIERALTVTAPESGSVWRGASTETVCWTSENAGATVSIEYTTDGGGSWETVLPKTPNDGSQTWTVPEGIDSTKCRIRVRSVEHPDLVGTSETFAIEPQPAPEPQTDRQLAVTTPNQNTSWTAGDTEVIRWTSKNAGTMVRIEYSADGGTAWHVITESTSNDGSFGWSIPGDVDSSRCNVRVTSRAYPEAADTSDVFTIRPERSLRITAPTGSTVWTAGTQQAVRWTSQAAGSQVRLDYSTDGGSTWKTISSGTANDGSYAWTIPGSMDSSRCRVRVTSRGYSTVTATSGIFRIEPPEAERGEVYALFVAVSDYKSAENDLNHPVSQNTVARMHEALGAWIDHVKVLNDRQATRAGILNAIDTFLGQADAEDTVFFHFAGHGTQVRDRNGDEIDGWDEAIVPYDENFITDDEIDARFAALPAARAILVFESCHSGTMERGLNVFTVYDPSASRGIDARGGTMLDDLESGDRKSVV